MSEEVRNDAARSQYELVEDGEVRGFAVYERTDDEIRFTHTEVSPEHRTQGRGARLVQAALDDVRESTALRVVPLCPFVADFVADHPDYQELTTR